MTLNPQNRLRHKDIMLLLFSQNVVFEKMSTKYPPNPKSSSFTTSEWPWGALGTRLGSRRSRDGVIFDLPNAPKSLTKQNNVVAKFIFSQDTNPKLECEISQVMDKYRLGPMIFGCYATTFNVKRWTQNLDQHKKLLKSGRINLFQDWEDTPLQEKKFNKLYIIIMENLYFNPHRGVIEGATINDIVYKKLDWTIPYKQIRDKVTKMHKLGIVHGDMHWDNILVQKIQSESGTIRYGARIIDFGASVYKHMSLASNREANIVLEKLPGAYIGINRGFNNPTTKREYITNKTLLPRLRNSAAWTRLEKLETNRRTSKKPGSAHLEYEKSYMVKA